MNAEVDRPVVEVERLTVRFGRTTAVDDASFVVGRGEVYALLGRNGSGKSTTIRCLLGQLKAQRGRTSVFSLDSWLNRTQIMGRIGVAPEVSDVPPEMTSKQVSAFVAPLYEKWDAQAFFDRLERFAVDPSRRFSRLSKGQRKQVGLALALSSDPEFVILDDPTLGLDAVARKALFDELIGELAEKGTTVLLTTHDLAGIEGVATHIGVIRDGSMVVDGNLEALKAGFRRVGFSRADRPDPPDLGRILARRDLGESEEMILAESNDEREEALRRWAWDGCTIEPLSLEEIFIAVSNDADGGVA